MAKTNQEIRDQIANSNNRQHRMLLMIFEMLILLCDVIVNCKSESYTRTLQRTKEDRPE